MSSEETTNEPKGRKAESDMSEKDHALADRVAGRTRFIAAVPSIGLLR